ncbi:MAG: hypothetical protein EPN47_03210 [Acidobacteria bacterium]|nr:MAG: hypothetical protein EPN47_03210 [Acidobacteriota bacterium]
MEQYFPPRIRLRGKPQLSQQDFAQLQKDFDDFREGLPRPLEPRILSVYGIDLKSEYAGLPVKNPLGKASGQLSLAAHQVEKDSSAGLGFVVLKTVIAQDSHGEQSMWEWAIHETRMTVERIRGRSGKEGWTVTWKGRGWYDTLEAYRDFFGQALSIGADSGMLIVPSVKYHLPTPEEDFWKEDEYDFTTKLLLEPWNKYCPALAMPLEKDFSPTLAGSGRAAQQAKILEWLARVPALIHAAAPGKVRAGLKMFNALFEDDFQLRMLDAVHQALGDNQADFLIYANRLFDPTKQYLDKVGVAFGGPDLSDRNLSVLEKFLAGQSVSRTKRKFLPVSATGDIHSGRIAAEYLLCGCSTFQMHTIFQLPDSEYAMNTGGKPEKALHLLLFHPEEGLIAWLLHLRAKFGWKSGMCVREMAEWCRDHWADVEAEFACDSH